MPRIDFLTLIVFDVLKSQLLSPFLLNRTSSFTHAQQIHCLGSLGWHPILYWVQSNLVPTKLITTLIVMINLISLKISVKNW